MNHDELDRQVREALRADPPEEQVARLERFWQQQSQADRRRRVRRTVAVAASLLLVATVSARLMWSEPTLQVEQANEETFVAAEPPVVDQIVPCVHDQVDSLAAQGKCITAFFGNGLVE